MSVYVFKRQNYQARQPFALLATTLAELDAFAHGLGITTQRRLAGTLPFYDLHCVDAAEAQTRGGELLTTYFGLFKALPTIERVEKVPA
jgi:hypothetical protein